MKLTSRMKPSLPVIATFALLVATGVPGPAQAGFFENLFGGGNPAPQSVPSSDYDAPTDLGSGPARRAQHHARRHVVVDDKPVRQKTTDIWHDRTLRDGDVVMMRDGLHVYTGSRGEKVAAQDLPRVENADLPKKERAVLVAMDMARTDPLATGAAPDTIASGRSAAVATSIVPGYKITDARGRSVRYVGP